MAAFKNIHVLLTADSKDLRSTLTSAARDVKGFDAAVQDSSRTVDKAGRLMKAGLAAGATAAAAGLAYAASKAVAFDSAMRNVNSISGLTEKALGDLQQRVISMSRALPQSATELAEGLYDIASSGFQGAEGLQVLEAAAVGASAGMSSTATAAKGITAILNAYGKTAKDAADVNDVLFQTVNLGVVSYDELAASIGDVAGIASAAKIDIDEIGSAVATMTLQGVSGSESMTLLTNLFTKMIKPSEALQEKLKELGYESGAALLETEGLGGAMEVLRGATNGQITALMELFPDIQASRGALALMANEGRTYADVSSKIADKEARRGAATKALTEQMKSAKNQAQMLKNELDAGATTIGLKVLPVMIDLLAGARELGTELSENLGTVVDALGPTWENLHEILVNTWDVLVTLGNAVSPVAEALATMGIGAVVASLNGLTEVLAAVTELLADNEAAAMILATALGVHLMGGVAVLATKLQVSLVMGLFNALTGMEKLGAGATGMGGKLVAAGAKLGAWGAILYTSQKMWDGYSKGADRAKDALDDFNASQESGSLEEQLAGVVNLNNEFDQMNRRLAELDSYDPDRGVWDLISGAAEELGLRLSIDEVAEAAARAEQEMFNLQGAVATYAAEQSGLDGAAAAKEFGTAAGAAKAFGDMLPTLSKAGVVVGDTLADVRTKVDNLRQSQVVGKDATKDVVAALGDLATGAKDSETAIDNLKNALDRLMGVFLTADQAAIGFESALDDMTNSAKENGRSLDINTEKGRANKSSIMDAVDALRAKIEADAAAGVGAEELSARLEEGRVRLREQAIQAGFTAGEMDALLERYNLTPELVQTIIEALGVQPTAAQLQALQGQLNTVDATNPNPRVSIRGIEGPDGAIARLTATQRILNDLAGISVTPTVKPPRDTRGLLVPDSLEQGDGPGRGGNALKRVMPVLNRLGGYVTSTYRTPAENARVGGSPTSYHLDRANPAVDIGGPPALLDRVHKTLKAMGGWRELLWRVPGHYDHVHAAAQGGYISGPGGPTDDAIPALLSNGEYVIRASAVKAVGTGALDQINRYATGGLVGYNPASKVTPTDAANAIIRAGGSPDDLREMLQLWTDYTEQVAKAAERTALLAEVTAGVEGATQRLAEFDAAAYRDKERQAVDRLIEAMERESRIREESYRQRVEVNNNLFRLGAIDLADHIANLDRRMAKEQMYSSEWMALYEQRKTAMQDDYQRRVSINNNLFELGKISLADHISNLDRRMAREQLYTDEWMSLYNQREQVLSQARRDNEQALTELNRMLDAEQAVMKQRAQAHEDYADAVTEAEQRAADATRELLNQRREQILEWIRLDERMSARGAVGFAITSDDEEGARRALRAAGLLTEAMSAWDDSQSSGPMSAADLAANAREQAAVIREWSEGLNGLRARGLSEEVIRALGLDESPESLAQVRAFAEATDAEIADLNAAVIDRTRAANERLEDDQAATFSEIALGLADIRRKLNEEMAEAQLALEEELAEAQEELDRIGRDQGRTYGDAIAAGMMSSIPAVRAAAEALAAATASLAGAGGGGTPGQTGTVNQVAQQVAQFRASIGLSADPTSDSIWADRIATGTSWDEVKTRLYQKLVSEWRSQIGLPADSTSDQVWAQRLMAGLASAVDVQARLYEKLQSGTYDVGGVLRPGMTLAYNGTGENEYVMKAAQLAAFGRTAAAGGYGGGRTVEVTYQVDARGAVEGTAVQISKALEQHTEDLLRVVGAGVGGGA